MATPHAPAPPAGPSAANTQAARRQAAPARAFTATAPEPRLPPGSPIGPIEPPPIPRPPVPRPPAPLPPPSPTPPPVPPPQPPTPPTVGGGDGQDWFAEPLQGNVPIAFLPLRLETHFATDDTGQPQLWVRAFPDDVHVDSFEPELTSAELAARRAFLADPAATSGDAAIRLAAWAGIARRFGPARAAWIVSPAAGAAGSKASDWTRPPSTALLPDRLIFVAQDATGLIVRQAGAEIADGLALGPSPAGGDPASDSTLRWMRDFDHAVAIGLGARLPISASQQAAGFTRVLVYGVKSRLPPPEGSGRLAQAFDAHHYTHGIEVLPLGTPTNNGEGVKSGYRTDDPGSAASFGVERGAPRTPSADGRGDGDRIAIAFGIPSETFAFVNGADGRHDDAPAAMNTVLWPATLGYYLANMVPQALTGIDALLPTARAHFNAWVRGRGPWPTLRIGRQSYGLLPVVASESYETLEADATLARLVALLRQLRPFWQSAAGNVARVVPGADPDTTLAAVLGMAPASTSLAGRSVIGPQFNGYYWSFLGKNVDARWYATLNELSTAQLGAHAAMLGATRVGNATYLDKHFSLTGALVAAALSDAPLVDNYLAVFGAMDVTQLRDAAPPPSPVPVLWLLARHAALRQYVDTAHALLGASVASADRVEAEIIGLEAGAAPGRVWNQLALALPEGGPVGAWLDAHKLDGPAEFAAFWHGLATLAGTRTTELDSALRESLDLCVHRIDAWFTSLASRRLDMLRGQAGNQQTLYIGAYGWVEDVKPRGATPSRGYVHAPSLNHAATSAVLRSGYLSHQDGGSGAAAIDLSSTRTRLALQVLEATRAGQPLGAQLGYQWERALHQRGLDVYIAHFRAIVRREEIAGDPVVDGLALLEAQSQVAWGNGQFPAVGSADYLALTGLFAELSDALDAISDLMLAESVHQLVNGSALRAGATVDALGRGDSPPPVMDVTRMPRRGGVITHRLLVLLADGPASGWPLTPRSLAEPRLAAFVAGILGPAARVRARATFVDAQETAVAQVDVAFEDTGLGPLDVIALADRLPGVQGQSEIEQRLVRVAAAMRPAAVAPDAVVRLTLGRDAATPADILCVDDLLTAAASARALLAGARAATGADLAPPASVADQGIDTTELQSRADNAAAAIAAARARVVAAVSAPEQESAFVGSSLFGIAGSVPEADPTGWGAQAVRVAALLDARMSQLAALDAGFTRAGAGPSALRDQDVARLRAVFGPGFAVVPRLLAAVAAQTAPLFARSEALLHGQSQEAVTYFSRVSRVREGVNKLDEALLCAEALGSGAQLELSVAQWPVVDGERWAGLPLAPGSAPVDRVCVLGLGKASTACAALFVDEWLETVPSPVETTGLAFHVDDASSRAPQSILLGVPPNSAAQWTLDTVEGTLLEAIDLAHLRAVDPDTLGAVGHFLPALFFAVNFGASPPDTVSTDLTLAAPPPRPFQPVPPIPIIGTGVFITGGQP